MLATGACNIATVPLLAAAVPASIAMLTPMEYRNPDQLDAGGVLVVGASATGIQLADEIHRSGRPVILSLGEHVRAPRIYRGRDIQWWIDAASVLDDRYDEIDDINRGRNVPSFQLVGSRKRDILDLNALTSIGVKLIGRLAAINDGKALFSGSLRNQCALADLKMTRLLDRIDVWATAHGLDAEVPPPHRFPATKVEGSPPLSLDLNKGSSGPSSGRPASGPTFRGSRCRSSIVRGASSTTRRGRLAGHVPDGDALPAATEVVPDRRCRRRRARSRRASCLIPQWGEHILIDTESRSLPAGSTRL